MSKETHPVYLIESAGTDITANGVHSIVLTGQARSGGYNIRTTGDYGGASIELGYTNIAGDEASFVVYDDGGPFTDNFSKQAGAGEVSTMAIRLTDIDAGGTTNIELISTEI